MLRPALLLLAIACLPAQAREPFPFGSALMLDARPLPGSKRVPTLEIDDDGAASIDLWCASLRARATVGNDSIAIVPGQVQASMQAAQCEPQRQAGDAALLAALAQATGWRRIGDLVVLSGPTPLRFRLMTN